VADVGEDKLLVHDEHRPDPTLAFALSRVADRPTVPTRSACFRDVDRPSYEDAVQSQLVTASERQGPADLAGLLQSGATWEVSATT